MNFRDISNKDEQKTNKPWTFNDITVGTLFRDAQSTHIYIRTTDIVDTDYDIWNAIQLDSGEYDHFDPYDAVEVYMDDVELDFSKFKAYFL